MFGLFLVVDVPNQTLFDSICPNLNKGWFNSLILNKITNK